MAKIGLKYLVASKLSEDESGYLEGFVIARAIKATITVTNNNVKLYADDGAVETDIRFNNGSLSLNVDDLTQKVYADLLGHTYTAAESTENGSPETVVASANDDAPYFGVGFYGKIRRRGKTLYQAKWLRKVQFSEPNDETDTKGESVSFQTPTIEGTVFQIDTGEWKEQAEFSDEQAARKWLENKIGKSDDDYVWLDENDNILTDENGEAFLIDDY